MAPATNGSTIAMRDGGEYNRHSGLQLRLLQAGLQYVKDLPKPAETIGGKPILAISDYGCSQGLNSALAMQEILSKQPPGTGAHIRLVDTPYNDWKAVSQTFDAHRAAISAEGTRPVLFEMVPNSFFNQCLPDASIDVGTAWSSLHFLSESRPLPPGTSPEEVIRRSRDHRPDVAHRDLVRFLTNRAREIRPGGVFAAGILCRVDKSDDPADSSNLINIWSAAVLARQELIREGRVAPEMATVVPPTHERSRGEMEAALDAVKDLWDVELLTNHTLAHPAYDELQAELKRGGDGGEEAYRTYAEKLVATSISVLGLIMIKPNTSTLEESAQEKELIGEFTERMVRVHFEKFKGEPATVTFWFLQLRRK